MRVNDIFVYYEIVVCTYHCFILKFFNLNGDFILQFFCFIIIEFFALQIFTII